MNPSHTGGCLCGAVRYAIEGPIRDVLICHCGECRRWHGGPGAYTATPREALVFERSGEEAVRWIESPASETGASRGFCGACGSSLFWSAPGRPTISIAAGSLDQPTGLRIAGHIHTASAADYERLDEGGGEHGLPVALWRTFQ